MKGMRRLCYMSGVCLRWKGCFSPLFPPHPFHPLRKWAVKLGKVISAYQCKAKKKKEKKKGDGKGGGRGKMKIKKKKKNDKKKRKKKGGEGKKKGKQC